MSLSHKKKQKIVSNEETDELEKYEEMHKQTGDWFHSRGFTDGKHQGFMNGCNPTNHTITIDLENINLLCERYQHMYQIGFFKGCSEGHLQGLNKKAHEDEQNNIIQDINHNILNSWEELLLNEPITESVLESVT